MSNLKLIKHLKVSVHINEVLENIFVEYYTPYFKNGDLESSPKRILAFKSFANLLVEYEYVKVSKQNQVIFRMDMLSVQISKAKKKKRMKTLLVNIRLNLRIGHPIPKSM